MTVTQIRYAIAVAETGSMTKAAARVGVRQPSVSSAIADLEREINIQLFERAARGVKLTKPGKEFFSEIPALCQCIARMEERYQPVVFR
ncbi:MAG: LysR family transcriptional regulator [Oscillospiraceae bacterium]|nr:LysR family transcriptional regulator [Oscillospiraceae bacterium]MBP0988281.1 LysR family transcriptional regulator [Oscillospiraceae bacterium]MBQ5340245.1 LysR family transcriptional regulator [Oscillospiraceae bacterium]